jgi:integrase
MVNNVIRDMRRHVHWAKLELTAPLTVHTLRKSFGQNRANAGTPIHVLQSLMGHASITTTREFYLQAADANDRAALARYESLLKGPGPETCVRLLYEQHSSRPSDNHVSITHFPQRA